MMPTRTWLKALRPLATCGRRALRMSPLMSIRRRAFSDRFTEEDDESTPPRVFKRPEKMIDERDGTLRGPGNLTSVGDRFCEVGTDNPMPTRFYADPTLDDTKEDGTAHVLYQPLEVDHISQAVAVAAEAFTLRGYPIATHIDYESGAYQYFEKYFFDLAIEGKLGIVATDTRSGQMIGVCCGRDFTFEPHIWFMRILQSRYKRKFDQLMELWAEAETPFVESFATEEVAKGRRGRKAAVPEGVYWHLATVAVDREATGRGVATGLVHASFELAREKGFQQAVVAAPNAIAKGAFEKNGFESFCELEYKDFNYPKDSDYHPLRHLVKENYERMSFMVRNPI